MAVSGRAPPARSPRAPEGLKRKNAELRRADEILKAASVSSRRNSTAHRGYS